MILDIINRVKEKIKWLLDGGFIGPPGFSKKYECNKNNNLKYV
jgi:hypothetical protein